MRSLADDRNLVVKKADKGSCVVVWDRDDYLLEASQQLENVSIYRNIVFKDRLLVNLVDTSNTMFRNLCRKGLISNKQLKYFTYEFKNATNLGKLYFLPKIHKKLHNVPGRPVISNCGAPTENTSEFLDHNLKSLMQSGKSYIKDTNDFLDKVRKLKNLPSNSILVTADVVGLYPSIPHDLGLEALEKALESRIQKIIPTEDLIEMASFVLKNNFFEFNDVVMQQISGTAIGTKFGPPYACIFMDQIENEFLKTQSLQPLVWLRYIDDIFFIWTHGGESLELFMNDLNGYHKNLKFTYENDKESVIFLDLCMKLQNGKIISDMHVKDTDRHQYLHYNSAHPAHIKKSIIYSQTLRVSRICSLEDDFIKHKEEMRSWFLKREYPNAVISTKMDKVDFYRSKTAQKTNKSCVPLVVTYHPLLNAITNIIHSNMYLLRMDHEVKSVFTPGPMISFRSARKLSSYLVRAKLYSIDRKVGSDKCCGSICQVCPNVVRTDSFSSSVTKNVYKINHRLTCNDKCLIYLLTCKKDLKIETCYQVKPITPFKYSLNHHLMILKQKN